MRRCCARGFGGGLGGGCPPRSGGVTAGRAQRAALRIGALVRRSRRGRSRCGGLGPPFPVRLLWLRLPESSSWGIFAISDDPAKPSVAEVAKLSTASQTGGTWRQGRGPASEQPPPAAVALSRSRGAFIAIRLPFYHDPGPQTGPGTASGRRFSRSWFRDCREPLIARQQI